MIEFSQFKLWGHVPRALPSSRRKRFPTGPGTEARLLVHTVYHPSTKESKIVNLNNPLRKVKETEWAQGNKRRSRQESGGEYEFSMHFLLTLLSPGPPAHVLPR